MLSALFSLASSEDKTLTPICALTKRDTLVPVSRTRCLSRADRSEVSLVASGMQRYLE